MELPNPIDASGKALIRERPSALLWQSELPVRLQADLLALEVDTLAELGVSPAP